MNNRERERESKRERNKIGNYENCIYLFQLKKLKLFRIVSNIISVILRKFYFLLLVFYNYYFLNFLMTHVFIFIINSSFYFSSTFNLKNYCFSVVVPMNANGFLLLFLNNNKKIILLMYFM